MKSSATYFLMIILFAFCACEEVPDYHPPKQNIFEEVSGQVQKGPFLNGTSITVSELDVKLKPTGKNYYSDVFDKRGTFHIDNMELSSPFVRLQANGFYFNEVTGKPSSAQLSLLGLGNLTSSSTVNVNIFTHLEKKRVEYLISKGYSFDDAKKQAQQEVLAIFEVQKEDIKSSENLDISREGDDNAILLAASVIAQGLRTEAELTELLANISSDIREDGVLNSSSSGSMLINDIKLIDLAQVRQKLEERYTDAGAEAIVPEFEKYVAHFIDLNGYEVTKTVEYPEMGSDGYLNILSADREKFSRINNFTAILPKGTSLKVVMTSTGGTPFWGILHEENTGWTFSPHDTYNKSQVFQSTETDRTIELTILLDRSGTAKLEIYENGAAEPTRIKHISW